MWVPRGQQHQWTKIFVPSISRTGFSKNLEAWTEVIFRLFRIHVDERVIFLSGIFLYFWASEDLNAFGNFLCKFIPPVVLIISVVLRTLSHVFSGHISDFTCWVVLEVDLIDSPLPRIWSHFQFHRSPTCRGVMLTELESPPPPGCSPPPSFFYQWYLMKNKTQKSIGLYTCS